MGTDGTVASIGDTLFHDCSFRYGTPGRVKGNVVEFRAIFANPAPAEIEVALQGLDGTIDSVEEVVSLPTDDLKAITL